MTTTGSLRVFGVIWIVIAPIIFLMAVISKVESDVAYEIQMAVCSTVAIASLIFGIATFVAPRAWSAMGLFVLSCLAAIYWLGTALAIFVWPTRATLAMRIALTAMIGGWGLPFLAMAVSLHRVTKGLRDGLA